MRPVILEELLKIADDLRIGRRGCKIAVLIIGALQTEVRSCWVRICLRFERVDNWGAYSIPPVARPSHSTCSQQSVRKPFRPLEQFRLSHIQHR